MPHALTIAGKSDIKLLEVGDNIKLEEVMDSVCVCVCVRTKQGLLASVLYHTFPGINVTIAMGGSFHALSEEHCRHSSV